MGFWTAVVVIVAIGAIASVLKARYNAKAGITEDYLGNQTLNRPSDTSSDEGAKAREKAAQQEIAQLKERIAVLERIATDNNSVSSQESARIASEIESLREPDADTKTP
ncbi:MAG: hypothetical protein AAGH57_06225 [Pseudomonadota bacterium]